MPGKLDLRPVLSYNTVNIASKYISQKLMNRSKYIMRIALLAPLWETVPPIKYGGTELVVSLLAEELTNLGHEVTLYACGGSKTNAHLVQVIDKPMHDTIGNFSFDCVHFQDFLSIKSVYDESLKDKFDIIHNHMEPFSTSIMGSFFSIPMVTTYHSSTAPGYEPISLMAKDGNYISISNSQRSLAPYLNYVATVYHGINTKNIQFCLKSSEYLLFLATISKSKGVDRAIKIAQKTNMKLIVAGNVCNDDDFELIRPYIDNERIIFLGEINAKQKNELMKNAKAYIFPIRWNEAFGLTVVESLASGTPVIAFRNGSLPELIDDGITGYLVNNIDQAVKAVNKIDNISREECRRQAVERFDAAIMAKNYETVYKNIIDKYKTQ